MDLRKDVGELGLNTCQMLFWKRKEKQTIVWLTTRCLRSVQAPQRDGFVLSGKDRDSGAAPQKRLDP